MLICLCVCKWNISTEFYESPGLALLFGSWKVHPDCSESVVGVGMLMLMMVVTGQCSK